MAVASSRRDKGQGTHTDKGQGLDFRALPRILPLEIKTGIWRPAMSITHRAQVKGWWWWMMTMMVVDEDDDGNNDDDDDDAFNTPSF